MHEGRRDSKCSECVKGFGQARDLKKHIDTVHEGEEWKRHKCVTCRKSFTQAYHMRSQRW